MEGKNGVTRRIIEGLHSWNIQRDYMGGESSVFRISDDEILYSDIQGDQMEGVTGVTRNIIDQLHSWDIQGYQMEGEGGVT